MIRPDVPAGQSSRGMNSEVIYSPRSSPPEGTQIDSFSPPSRANGTPGLPRSSFPPSPDGRLSEDTERMNLRNQTIPRARRGHIPAGTGPLSGRIARMGIRGSSDQRFGNVNDVALLELKILDFSALDPGDVDFNRGFPARFVLAGHDDLPFGRPFGKAARLGDGLG
jgi:hypothetical protein